MSGDPSAVATEIRADLAHALVAVDFDGTLAPIVPDPADSRPAPGAVTALRRLVKGGAAVAIVTGRNARTVVDLGGLDAVPGLRVSGLYGAEEWQDGHLTEPDEPPQLAKLRSRLPGCSLTRVRTLVCGSRTSGSRSSSTRARPATRQGALGAADAGRSPPWPPSSGSRFTPVGDVLEIRLPGVRQGQRLAAAHCRDEPAAACVHR